MKVLYIIICQYNSSFSWSCLYSMDMKIYNQSNHKHYFMKLDGITSEVFMGLDVLKLLSYNLMGSPDGMEINVINIL